MVCIIYITNHETPGKTLRKYLTKSVFQKSWFNDHMYTKLTQEIS